MPQRLCVIILLVLFSAHEANSITIENALSQALKNNPDLQTLRMEEEVAGGRLKKAQLPLTSNPVMESYVSGKDKLQEEGGGQYTNYGVKISQEFEIAGQRNLRIDIAHKELSRLALEIKDKERVLSFEVKEAFARALAAKKKEALTGQVVSLQAELLNFTKIKFQAGEVSGLEVNLAEVELSTSKKDLMLAGRESFDALLGLQGLMGKRADAFLDIEGDLTPANLHLPDKATLEKPLKTERPDIKAVSIEVDMAKTGVELARKSVVPNIVLGGFYNRDELRNDLGVSLSISIPLFDQKQAEKKEAQVRAAQARVKKAGLERTINQEFEEAYNALAVSQRELSIFKKEILDKSMENLGLLNLAYREGKIGFFNVKQAQKDTMDTQFAYLDTLLRARRALNALEKATGGDLK
jgi:outer membrane protein, heavy metal efflux system